MKSNHLSMVLYFLLIFSDSLHAAEFYLMRGYQGGGEFEGISGENYKLDETNNWGFIVGFESGGDQDIEISYSHQSTSLIDKSSNPHDTLFDIDVDYFQLGGTVLLNDYQGWKSFLLGSVGAVHLSPQHTSQQNLDSETGLALGLGIGVKKTITEHIILRAETKLFGTLLDQGSAIFCTNGGCSVFVEGDLETQFQVNVGIGVRF